MRWQSSGELSLLLRPGEQEAYGHAAQLLSPMQQSFLLEQTLDARRRLGIANPNVRLLLEDFLSTCAAVARRGQRVR